MDVIGNIEEVSKSVCSVSEKSNNFISKVESMYAEAAGWLI